ncbi:hypothetical protein FJZ19_05715 [Candidatus Pacearchaeota archaeon]|nr:hypothetical protein [Candidatus Pacearchaeota archaeon]
MKAEDILNKYSRKIENEIESEKPAGNFSREFLQFKRDLMPHLSRYENWCNTIGNIIKINVSEKDKTRIQKHIDIAHLNITPSQSLTLAVMALLVTFFAGVLGSIGIFLITESFPVMLLVLVLMLSLFLFYYVYTMPMRLANSWRLKASSQMVPCILYVVAYMKHTSNLERAISFTAQHLSPPLSLDFRKIFWDVETGKYSTIRESLDAYLETWRDYSIEFIESFHLIESSLYEPSEEKRIASLERALQVILDGVYEKMLKYTHTIRSPLTNIYMLGIVLPTLGLALLPLASTLLGGMFSWYHIFILFNLIVPFFVFYLTNEVMLKRPGGYGETSVLELNPLYPQYKSKKPYLIAFLICIPLFIIGLMPFIFQIDFLTYNINNQNDNFAIFGLKSDYTFSEIHLGFLGESKIFNFMEDENGNIVGPFGLLALILSLFIPLSIALFFSISYKIKSRELIKSRESSKQLEKEFASSLFQLGNRIGDGMPAEIAFARVAESSKGLVTENFFKTVNTNIQQMGMGLEQAIFSPRRGAIIYYPSMLISISMKILVESVKKGLNVAARSLMSISEYVKNISKINERLNDLLAEIVSDMKSNMTFLAPLLAGIVVGLGSMIVMILSKLQELTPTVGGEAGMDLGGVAGALSVFDITKMIPPYFLQISIGIYIIEIIFILTSTLVTVDSGEDKLKKVYDTGNNLLTGGLFYLITALIAVIALAVLAIVALSGLG